MAGGRGEEGLSLQSSKLSFNQAIEGTLCEAWASRSSPTPVPAPPHS